MAAYGNAARSFLQGGCALIFVTVGTQLPFDRLVKTMDAWAARHPAEQVFGQIGNSAYTPQFVIWTRFSPPESFREKYQAADLIVSHAGIGNILLAIELQKPIIVMPRRAELGEHRNDHQMATVKRLQEKAGIGVIYEAAELDQAIQCTRATNIRPSRPTAASTELLTTIRDFIGADS
ncbi:MAG TPA: glycosyltransferase [Nitrosospira sp.]